MIFPDGHWVGYESLQSGNWEIYVQAFTGPGPGNRVSARGGTGARWNPKGGELFYQSENSIWAVRVENGVPPGSPTRGVVRARFLSANANLVAAKLGRRAGTGQRFLVVAPEQSDPGRLERNRKKSDLSRQ